MFDEAVPSCIYVSDGMSMVEECESHLKYSEVTKKSTFKCLTLDKPLDKLEADASGSRAVRVPTIAVPATSAPFPATSVP